MYICAYIHIFLVLRVCIHIIYVYKDLSSQENIVPKLPFSIKELTLGHHDKYMNWVISTYLLAQHNCETRWIMFHLGFAPCNYCRKTQHLYSGQSSQAPGCWFPSPVHWLSQGCWPGFYFQLEFPPLGSFDPHPEGHFPGSLFSAPPCPLLWNWREFQAHSPAKSNQKKTQRHYALYLVGTRFCEPPKLLLGDTKVTFTQEAAET